jgi:predicted nucleic acid-binding protein
MARVVDTSVLFALEQGGRDVDDILAVPRENPTFVTAITVSELLIGLHRTQGGRNHLLRMAFIDSVIARTTVLPFDLECARVHAEITARLMSQGQPIGINDTLIGAIAPAHGHSVLTINSKHFERIPGLVVERPVWSQ